jgi:hypothetical protein
MRRDAVGEKFRCLGSHIDIGDIKFVEFPCVSSLNNCVKEINEIAMIDSHVV